MLFHAYDAHGVLLIHVQHSAPGVRTHSNDCMHCLGQPLFLNADLLASLRKSVLAVWVLVIVNCFQLLANNMSSNVNQVSHYWMLTAPIQTDFDHARTRNKPA